MSITTPFSFSPDIPKNKVNMFNSWLLQYEGKYQVNKEKKEIDIEKLEKIKINATT